MFIVIVPPAREPVGIEDMRQYLRLDGSDDATVLGLIAAAREAVENYCGQALIDRKIRYECVCRDKQKKDLRIELPLGPVSGVDVVRFYDRSGVVLGTLTAEGYRLDNSTLPGYVNLLDENASFWMAGPDTFVQMEMTVGYGQGAEDVPNLVRLAIMQLVAFWYENRGDEIEAQSRGFPHTVTAMLQPFRLIGIR